ncbi:hypothetical protein [Novosphingobium sp. Leaf2]|uniref:hypothetical protein n=1 Tax=Novosphingobium sp. Leaf2 TaxID=1735670 RepID=UPI0006F4ABCD|nr:hypothetical protein [Novosphingobium sp. Leaf2]KQM22031.1 hypothetical protein ASE49_01615 [Novosphingobium sp. Leaf2]
MTDKPDLDTRVRATLSQDVVPQVRAFAERLAHASGAVAVLFYGSNLRTGALDGVLDFYVLLPGPQIERIWPRVSYHEWTCGGTPLRAKVATMALETFAQAAAGQRLDTTIWARFVQFSALVWYRDCATHAKVAAAIADAARTAARLAAALGPPRGTPQDYWRALFRATYAAEFRVEKAGREDSILAADPAHFDGLLPLAWVADGIAFSVSDGITLEPALDARTRVRTLAWWKRRQRLGKPYNVVRLLKASTTFDGAARYAAWKIERHTGVPVAISPWRERHPVLAAPGVLWQVWRGKKKARGA